MRYGRSREPVAVRRELLKIMERLFGPEWGDWYFHKTVDFNPVLLRTRGKVVVCSGLGPYRVTPFFHARCRCRRKVVMKHDYQWYCATHIQQKPLPAPVDSPLIVHWPKPDAYSQSMNGEAADGFTQEEVMALGVPARDLYRAIYRLSGASVRIAFVGAKDAFGFQALRFHREDVHRLAESIAEDTASRIAV